WADKWRQAIASSVDRPQPDAPTKRDRKQRQPQEAPAPGQRGNASAPATGCSRCSTYSKPPRASPLLLTVYQGREFTPDDKLSWVKISSLCFFFSPHDILF